MIIADLFRRFTLISLVAFGGGQGALPLMERVAVAETGWVSPQEFAAAVALGYITPGPMIILATFIGFRVAGLAGALAATLGVFLVPAILATAVAQALHRYMQHPWVKGFGQGAAPAVVGLLGVTAFSLFRASFTGWVFPVLTATALLLALRTSVHPFLILAGGAVIGLGIGAVAPSPP